MLPINFLFLTVWPVVEMRLRCKSGGRDYPPGVPEEITKVLELDVVSFKDIQAVINENFRITFFFIFAHVTSTWKYSLADQVEASRT